MRRELGQDCLRHALTFLLQLAGSKLFPTTETQSALEFMNG
jgi:hypothetical protein